MTDPQFQNLKINQINLDAARVSNALIAVLRALRDFSVGVEELDEQKAPLSGLQEILRAGLPSKVDRVDELTRKLEEKVSNSLGRVEHLESVWRNVGRLTPEAIQGLDRVREPLVLLENRLAATDGEHIARVGGTNKKRLCDSIAERLKEADEWLHQQPRDRQPLKTPPGRKRRRPLEIKDRPLTAKQTEAMQIVGECNGNLAQAARSLGIDRKTLKESYDAACRKLGCTAVRPAIKTMAIPTDHRGQAAIDEDRRRQ